MANKSKDVKTVPAGINDKFEIAVADINNVVENKKAKLKAKGIKIPILSTELQQNVCIRVFNGGLDKGMEKE